MPIIYKHLLLDIGVSNEGMFHYNSSNWHWCSDWIILISCDFSQLRVVTGEASIERAKESFRIIAKRGAVCFDTMQHLREINPLYQTAFSQFLYLFDAATSHSDR